MVEVEVEVVAKLPIAIELDVSHCFCKRELIGSFYLVATHLITGNCTGTEKERGLRSRSVACVYSDSRGFWGGAPFLCVEVPFTYGRLQRMG